MYLGEEMYESYRKAIDYEEFEGGAEGEEEVDSHDGEEAEGLEEIPLEKRRTWCYPERVCSTNSKLKRRLCFLPLLVSFACFSALSAPRFLSGGLHGARGRRGRFTTAYLTKSEGKMTWNTGYLEWRQISAITLTGRFRTERL